MHTLKEKRSEHLAETQRSHVERSKNYQSSFTFSNCSCPKINEPSKGMAMWRYTGRICIDVRRHSSTFIISRVLDSIHCLPTSIVLSRVSSSWDIGLKKRFCSSAHINTITKVTEKEDMGAKGTHTVDTTSRLQNIRTLMRQGDVNVDAYVVPSEDQRECLDLPLSR